MHYHLGMWEWKSNNPYKRAHWINKANPNKDRDQKRLKQLATTEPDDELRAMAVEKLAHAQCDIAFAKADESYDIRKIYYNHHPEDRSLAVLTDMLYSEVNEQAKIQAFEMITEPASEFLVNVILRHVSPHIAKIAFQQLRKRDDLDLETRKKLFEKSPEREIYATVFDGITIRDDAFFLSIAHDHKHSFGKREVAIGMLRDLDSLERFDTAGQHLRIINAVQVRKTWWHETMVLNSAFWDHGVRWESLRYVNDNEVLRKAAADKQHPYNFREAAVKRVQSKETLEQILSDVEYRSSTMWRVRVWNPSD